MIMSLSSASPFISTWDTSLTSSGSSDSSTISLPLVSSGTYDFNVSWGDGNTNLVTTYNSTNATHTYATPDNYTISINGTINGWSFENAGVSDSKKILDISQWGVLRMGNSGGSFYGTSNLNLSATDLPDFSGMYTIEDLFRGSGISTVPNMGDWDVSHIRNMNSAFQGAHSFNQNIDNWSTSWVTSMDSMFQGATSFNQPIDKWDVSSVTSMYSTFQSATSFNQPLNNWTTTSLTSIGNMFSGATSFNQNISNWDVSHVTTLYSTFESATSFNQPLDSWDVSNVGDMRNTFSDASSFNQTLKDWNTSSVWSMANMFTTTVFNQNISNWDTSHVTSMSSMFGNSHFNQPVNNWNTTSVTDMSSMFYDSHFNQPLDNWDVSSVTSMYSMFMGSPFNQNISNWNTTSVTSMANMFMYDTSFNQQINNWDVSKVTTMSSMFNDATSFDEPLNNWNVSNVGGMSNMFSGVTLSTSNYDGILNDWSKENLQSSVSFDAGNSYYSSSAVDARAVLTNTSGFAWTITDGGFYNTTTKVVLTSPLDSISSSSLSQDFVSNESSNLNLIDTTLYLWNSNGELLNSSSKSLSTNSSLTNWTYNFSSYGNYLWNVKACDSIGYCAFASKNYTLLLGNQISSQRNEENLQGMPSYNSKFSQSFDSISRGVPAVVNVSNTLDLGLMNITILSKRDIGYALTDIYPIDSADIPDTVSVYKVFQINIYGFNDSDLNNVSFYFKVNKTWADSLNLTPYEILFYRNSGSGWKPQNTTFINKDSNYYYFGAFSEGFSQEAIAAIPENSQNCSLGTNCSNGQKPVSRDNLSGNKEFFSVIWNFLSRTTLGNIIVLVFVLTLIFGILYYVFSK